MKTASALLASLLLAGTVGATRAAIAADGVIYKQELIPGSYCHLKFPAIQGGTRAGDRPVLKDSSDGDAIDFYGPCDEDPLGQDQIHEQKLDRYHRFQHDYED